MKLYRSIHSFFNPGNSTMKGVYTTCALLWLMCFGVSQASMYLYPNGSLLMRSVGQNANIILQPSGAGKVVVGNANQMELKTGQLVLEDNSISGDKIEGGAINSINIGTLTNTLLQTTSVEVGNMVLDANALSSKSGNDLLLSGGTDKVKIKAGNELDVSQATLKIGSSTLGFDSISGDAIQGGTIGSIQINSLTSTTINTGQMKGGNIQVENSEVRAVSNNLTLIPDSGTVFIENGNTLDLTKGKISLAEKALKGPELNDGSVDRLSVKDLSLGDASKPVKLSVKEGKLGVNVDQPAATLHVNGSVQFKGHRDSHSWLPSGVMRKQELAMVENQGNTPFSPRDAIPEYDAGNIDLSSLTAPGAATFVTTITDGRYMYFIPGYDGKPDANYLGTFLRMDTECNYQEKGCWKRFDVTVIAAELTCFGGAAFDGRYLYAVPSNLTNFIFLRYDTYSEFSDATSWDTVDLRTVPGAAPDTNKRDIVDFQGAVYDGIFVYLVPYRCALTAKCARFVRYNTRKSFTDNDSYEIQDIYQFFGNPFYGYRNGLAFGRFVYFCGYTTGRNLQFQSGGSFKNATSWAKFGQPTIWGYSSAVSDGRFVYFSASYLGMSSGLPVGGLTRYDSRSNFNAPGSYLYWEIPTLSSIDHCIVVGGYLLCMSKGNKNNAGQFISVDLNDKFNSDSPWAINVTMSNTHYKGFSSIVAKNGYMFFVPFYDTFLLGLHVGPVSDKQTLASLAVGESFYINSLGCVGIGTKSPETTLHVTGTTKFNGAVGIGTDPPATGVLVNGGITASYLSATGNMVASSGYVLGNDLRYYNHMYYNNDIVTTMKFIKTTVGRQLSDLPKTATVAHSLGNTNYFPTVSLVNSQIDNSTFVVMFFVAGYVLLIRFTGVFAFTINSIGINGFNVVICRIAVAEKQCAAWTGEVVLYTVLHYIVD